MLVYIAFLQKQYTFSTIYLLKIRFPVRKWHFFKRNLLTETTRFVDAQGYSGGCSF